MDERLELFSLGVYTIAGKCVHHVVLDRECWDFAWLENKEATLNGIAVRVVAVERYTHAPPWTVGEPLGLIVEELDE